MAQMRADEITTLLRQEIENYERVIDVSETGSVISLGDGIARIHGLEKVMAGELIQFPHDVAGKAPKPGEKQGGGGRFGGFWGNQKGAGEGRTGGRISLSGGGGLSARLGHARVGRL